MPIIDVAGDGITPTTLELIGYNGRIQINTLTAGDVLVVTGDAHLTLDSTCVGGTVTIAGDVKVTDNSSGTTLVVANIADIRVPTDKMTFDVTNRLDVNTRAINSAVVVGDGNATPWDGA